MRRRRCRRKPLEELTEIPQQRRREIEEMAQRAQDVYDRRLEQVSDSVPPEDPEALEMRLAHECLAEIGRLRSCRSAMLSYQRAHGRCAQAS